MAQHEYKGERSPLIAHADRKGPEGMEIDKAREDKVIIDGIAGLRSAGGEGR